MSNINAKSAPQRDFSKVYAALETPPATGISLQSRLFEVMQLIEAAAFEKIGPYLTEDASFELKGMPVMECSVQGREAVVEQLRQNFGKVAVQRSEITKILESGNEIVLQIREQGRLLDDEQHYEIRAIFWFLFQGDQIHAIEEIVAFGKRRD